MEEKKAITAVRFILVRHGRTVYNDEKRFTGQKDIALSEHGKMQAKITSEYVLKKYKPDLIYASDLSRAIETVNLVAETLGIPIKTDKRLREKSLGDWTGMRIEEVKEKFPKEFETYRNGASAVNGESRADIENRAMEFFQELAQKERGKTILVSSHNGLLGAFLRRISCVKEQGSNLFLPNCSVSEAVYENGEFTALIVGFDKHLDGQI